MKLSDFTFTDLPQIQPRLIRKAAAEHYCGGERNLESLRKAGWVVPLRQHNSNTTFDVRDLDAAIDRARLEGWPECK